MGDGAIFKAIPAIMAEVGAIAKDRTNVAQNYKFRGIDDVYNALHDLFIKYKIFTIPEVLEEKDDTVITSKGTTLFYARLKIKYTFFAEDGSFVTAVVRGEGMDSGDKASNKAMAVAHKYALIQTFAIPTSDGVDPENESHDIKAVKPEDKPKEDDSEFGKTAKVGKECKDSGLFTEDELKAMRAALDKARTEVPSLRFLADTWKIQLAGRKPPKNEEVPFGGKF
jgi:hypothetical protein